MYVYVYILYSRKYWRELNLTVGLKIAIATILVDLYLVVRYRIAIRIHASKKYWRIIILAVAQTDHQSANFNSQSNFLAIHVYKVYQLWAVH